MDLLSELQHAEFKEAFDEFDKVNIQSSYPRTKVNTRKQLDLYYKTFNGCTEFCTVGSWCAFLLVTSALVSLFEGDYPE
jgi:hypothetical protein